MESPFSDTEPRAADAHSSYMHDPKVEVLIPDQFMGEGIKKTQAYKTPLTKI